MKRFALPAVLFASLLPLQSHAAQWIDGSFAMMTAEDCHLNPVLTSCYMDDAAKAEKTVDDLARMGVTRFLLPSASLAQMQRLAKPIKDRGLTFYTYEGWTWRNVRRNPTGTDNCATYTADRIDPELAVLKTQYGAAFAGLHYIDEPAETDVGNLQKLTACVKSDPRLANLKIIINLLPLHANNASLLGQGNPGHLDPPEYGMSCPSGTSVDNGLKQQMIDRYSAYARAIADASQADYLAFNFYPFVPQMESCPAARDLILSENMAIVGNVARTRSKQAIAYLQNAKTINPNSPAVTPEPFNYVNFHKLRWYASWFYAFGGHGFANYISHDVCLNEGNDQHNITDGCRPADTWGLIHQNGEETPLADDQRSLHGFARQAQYELSQYRYTGVVGNALGVPSGQLVGWLSTDQVLAGEYGVATDDRALVFFARRSPDTAGSATIGLSKWWVKVEHYDFASGQWQVVGNSTNSINVSLSAFPGALYRLSSQ